MGAKCYASIGLSIKAIGAITIPVIIVQNGVNKIHLACVMSEKYAFWVILRPLESMRLGKAELIKLQY